MALSHLSVLALDDCSKLNKLALNRSQVLPTDGLSQAALAHDLSVQDRMPTCHMRLGRPQLRIACTH